VHRQDLSEIVKIKEAAEADLLERPDVTAVDVGYLSTSAARKPLKLRSVSM